MSGKLLQQICIMEEYRKAILREKDPFRRNELITQMKALL
jgi:hypothetical protein